MVQVVRACRISQAVLACRNVRSFNYKKSATRVSSKRVVASMTNIIARQEKSDDIMGEPRLVKTGRNLG